MLDTSRTPRKLFAFLLGGALGTALVGGCSGGPDDGECRSYCERLGDYGSGRCFSSDSGCQQESDECFAAWVDKCTEICLDEAEGSADLEDSCADESWFSCSTALCCTSWYYTSSQREVTCE